MAGEADRDQRSGTWGLLVFPPQQEQLRCCSAKEAVGARSDHCCLNDREIAVCRGPGRSWFSFGCRRLQQRAVSGALAACVATASMCSLPQVSGEPKTNSLTNWGRSALGVGHSLA